jgi:hypothetical protein
LTTSAAAGSLASLDGDAALSADREETKYVIADDRRAELIALLERHLPSHRYRGEGNNPLPYPTHYVTTIYFDTPSLSHYRAACATPQNNVKLRAKEYYDLHPSLAELATDSDEVVHQASWVWLELKRKAFDHTSKHRARIHRARIPNWVAEAGTAGIEHLQGLELADAEAIRAYCRSVPEPLVASCVVNYRRSSWQAPDGLLRVTLDRDLSFYAAPPDLWLRQRALMRTTLGLSRKKEDRALLEIKRRSPAMPAWLERALETVNAQPIAYSKFVRAMRAVHDA